MGIIDGMLEIINPDRSTQSGEFSLPVESFVQSTAVERLLTLGAAVDLVNLSLAKNPVATRQRLIQEATTRTNTLASVVGIKNQEDMNDLGVSDHHRLEAAARAALEAAQRLAA